MPRTPGVIVFGDRVRVGARKAVSAAGCVFSGDFRRVLAALEWASVSSERTTVVQTETNRLSMFRSCSRRIVLRAFSSAGACYSALKVMLVGGTIRKIV